MNDDQNIDRRDEILAKFRESIRKPLSERYFDEDELLEIFDYAGDINDDYLRVEALLCAARFYPDSEDFMERKAVFYSQNSEAFRDRFLNDNQQAQSMIFDLLRIDRVADSDIDKAMDMLDQVIEKYDNFTDEEIIQLISVGARAGNTEWIKKRLPRIRRKSGYLNILLYEVAVNADSLGDMDLAVKMLEELTEIEPFNAGFWMMLAREYAGIEDAAKSMQAVEYALAIDPDDPQARFIKARLLFVENQDSVEVRQIMEGVVKDDPDMLEYTKFLSAIYHEQDMEDKAMQILLDFFNAHKEEAYPIIPDIVQYNPPEIDALLDEFYLRSSDTSQFLWTSWAHQMMTIGKPEVSQKIIEAYSRNSGEKLLTMLNVINPFLNKDFDETLEQLNAYLEQTDYSDAEFPTMVIIHLVTMLRLGRLTDALEFSHFILQNIPARANMSISRRLEFNGLVQILGSVSDAIRLHPDPGYWSDYDPLDIWSSGNS